MNKNKIKQFGMVFLISLILALIVETLLHPDKSLLYNIMIAGVYAILFAVLEVFIYKTKRFSK